MATTRALLLPIVTAKNQIIAERMVNAPPKMGNVLQVLTVTAVNRQDARKTVNALSKMIYAGMVQMLTVESLKDVKCLASVRISEKIDMEESVAELLLVPIAVSRLIAGPSVFAILGRIPT